MRQAAIIYSPGDGAVAALAAELGRAFDPGEYQVRLKEAGEAHMPDFAAADVVLLGSQPEGRAAIHSDFAEIARSLRGINLAGRVAGLFAVGSRKTLETLRKALKDTDIRVASEDLILEPGEGHRQGEKAKSWVRSVAGLAERSRAAAEQER